MRIKTSRWPVGDSRRYIGRKSGEGGSGVVITCGIVVVVGGQKVVLKRTDSVRCKTTADVVVLHPIGYLTSLRRIQMSNGGQVGGWGPLCGATRIQCGLDGDGRWGNGRWFTVNERIASLLHRQRSCVWSYLVC